MNKKNLINRALGKPAVDEFADQPIAEDSAFPLAPIADDPPSDDAILPRPDSEIRSEADMQAKGEEELLIVAEDLPRMDLFLVTVDGVNPIDLWQFVLGENPMNDAPGAYDVDAHALYIELNTFDRQLIVALNRDPRAPLSEGGPTFLDLCAGFRITRVKHVVSSVREHETPLYYESVVRLDGPMRIDRPGACRDLYRLDRWYRVTRSAQPFDPQEWLTLATSTSKPSKTLGVTYGAVLLDTNPHLDAGWVL